MFIVVKHIKSNGKCEILAAATDAQACMSVLEEFGITAEDAETATARAMFRSGLEYPAVTWYEDKHSAFTVEQFQGAVKTF